jgi:hypothetical protein
MIFESIDVSDRQTNIMQEVILYMITQYYFNWLFRFIKTVWFSMVFGSMVVSDRQRNIL